MDLANHESAIWDAGISNSCQIADHHFAKSLCRTPVCRHFCISVFPTLPICQNHIAEFFIYVLCFHLTCFMDVSDNDRSVIVGTGLLMSIYAFSMHNIK